MITPFMKSKYEVLKCLLCDRITPDAFLLRKRRMYMSTGITEHEVDMHEIICRFYPHPQYPDEGYYQLQTSDGDFLGNVGVDELDCELAAIKKQGNRTVRFIG